MSTDAKEIRSFRPRHVALSPCTQDSRNFYLLDVYDNCDGDRDVELVDPAPVLQLKRREGKRPAILIGLRDNENDSGVIKVRSIDPSETHD